MTQEHPKLDAYGPAREYRRRIPEWKSMGTKHDPTHHSGNKPSFCVLSTIHKLVLSCYRLLASLLLMLAPVIIMSCGDVLEPPEESPFDTFITSGPQNGVIVTEPSVTFQWQGSNKLVGEFSYRCSPYQEEWSVWSSDRSVTYYLDQGEYVFEVIGRYEAENEDDTPAQRAFTVNIPGPGILLKPLKQMVILRQEFVVAVMADDVMDVMLIHLILGYNPTHLQALDAVPGQVFQIGSAPMLFQEIDHSKGLIDINISTIGAEPSRINGTAEVVSIRFRTLSVGSSSMTVDSKSEFRDSENSPIDIINRVGSAVEIESD